MLRAILGELRESIGLEQWFLAPAWATDTLGRRNGGLSSETYEAGAPASQLGVLPGRIVARHTGS